MHTYHPWKMPNPGMRCLRAGPVGLLFDPRPKIPRPWTGHGRVWITSELDIIEGESTSSFAKLVGLADTANGLAPLASPPKRMCSLPMLI